MKKYHWFNGIKAQIVLFYVGAAFVTVILIGFILYYSISGVVLEENLSNTKMAVDKSGTYIESYVDKVKDMSYVIANNPSTLTYLESQEGTEADKDNIMNMITSTIKADSSIASIIIVGKRGQLISNETTLDMSMSEDMMKETWYVDAIDSGSMPVLTSARMQKFNMDKDNWVISLSREIVGSQGNNIGVMLVDLKYSVLEDYLKGLDLGSQGYAFILNQKDEVVYHEDPIYFENSDKRLELVEIGAMSPGYDAKTNQLYHEYELSNANWTLSGVASLDELQIIRRQLVETIILVGLVGIGILLLLGTLIAGRITEPIKRLEKAMKDIEKGLYEIESDPKGCNEAQSLAEHYNRMLLRIKALMADVSDQERAIRAYELNVLHSQINPHFLYNTLDTIVWMAEFGNSDKVVEVTKSLAKFFRLSLSGGSEITTVEREVDHVRQYLFIQKERYKDQLTYTITVNEEVEEVEIPKIILQPIVENAIYHGIRGLDKVGLIEINVTSDEEAVIMTVKDNGAGFDTGQLKLQDPTKDIKLGGVGIENVNQRLKLAYGHSYGVTTKSQVGKGTTVILRVGKVMKKAYNGHDS